MSEIQGKLVTLKEYAESIGMSYEGVRKKLRRHEAELQDHIVIERRTTFIDQYAVDFLNQHRRLETVQVIEQNEDYEAMKTKLINALERLDSLKDIKYQLELNNQEMLHRLEKYDSIMVDMERLQEVIEQKEIEIKELRTANATLADSLEEERNRKWWQRFRRKGI